MISWLYGKKESVEHCNSYFSVTVKDKMQMGRNYYAVNFLTLN